jgi:hypothetical protein
LVNSYGLKLRYCLDAIRQSLDVSHVSPGSAANFYISDLHCRVHHGCPVSGFCKAVSKSLTEFDTTVFMIQLTVLS